MSPHAFTEDQLVEQPAVALFGELGWATVSASDEVFGPQGTLQRETKSDVVLVSRLRAALERLNPGLPAEAITAAVDELKLRPRSAMPLWPGRIARSISCSRTASRSPCPTRSTAGRRPSGCG